MRVKTTPVLLVGSWLTLAAAAEPEVDPATLHPFPALSPVEALRSFEIVPGFRLELAAAEPEVVDPIAMAFDAHGALYVVEMRDYSERRAERLSRVRRLTDRDGDGRFETSTVFLDGLAWATGVACAEGSVIVLATPDVIVARDTDGDGVADERRVVVTGFGEGKERLNVQALPNSLTWGPDGRLHGATAANGGRLRRVENGTPVGDAVDVNGADFSLNPRTWEIRRDGPTAQYGLTFDALGRKFVCSNSHHLQWVPFRGSGPGLIDIPVDGPAAEVFRLSPDEPWRVVRTNWRASGLVPGLVEGGGRASGYFTSACGVHVAKGRVAPGDVFVCDVGSNLVHRKRLRETGAGPVAERVPGEEKREFLASRDTWFRPVAFADGPDGALYLADMYRETIEHPDSLPPALKKHLDLNAGNDRGRIWRIVAEKPPAGNASAWPEVSTESEIRRALASDDPVLQMAGLRAVGASQAARTFTPEMAALVEKASAGVRNEAAVVIARGEFAERVAWLAKLHGRGVPLDAVVPGLRTPAEQAAFVAGLAALSPEAALELHARLSLAPDARLQEMAGDFLEKPATMAAALTVLTRSDAALARRLALDSSRSLELRREALRRWRAGTELSLAEWLSFPPPLRGEAMDRVLASPNGVDVVLSALEAKTLPLDALSAAQVAALRSHRSSAVRDRAVALFGQPVDRTELIARLQPALSLPGDAAKGREIFLQRCATCHRDGPDGAAIGPDRVTFRNKGKPLLLVAILDPSREVAPQFTLATAVTKDGRTLTGLVTRDEASQFSLRQPGGAEVTLDRAEVESLTVSARSLMPEGLETGLEPQALADLLEFLVK